MFRIDAYAFNSDEYLVIEEKGLFASQAALELLASRRMGIGADRIILVDKLTRTIAAVADNHGYELKPSMEDLVVMKAYLDHTARQVYHFEYRLTDCFYQQVITAGTIATKAAC